MIRSLFLMILAFVLVTLFGPFVFIFNLFYQKNLKQYFYTIAVGLDQLGGSLLYNEEDWTVSSYTYCLCMFNKPFACGFMKFINFFFGKDHCEKAFEHEYRKMSKEIKNVSSM